MSVTLFVVLKHSLPLIEVESGCSAALRELLNIENIPTVTATFDTSDSPGNSSANVLNEDSRPVLVSLLGYQERVSVTPLTVPTVISGDETSVNEHYLTIKWHVKKTPLCWALVAAVAVAVARSQNAQIQDDAGFFSRSELLEADDFYHIVRVPTPQVDLEIAAAVLYARIPKSAEITEWLERTRGTL